MTGMFWVPSNRRLQGGPWVWFIVEGRLPNVGEAMYQHGPLTVATTGRILVGTALFSDVATSHCCVAVLPQIALEMQPDGKMHLPAPKK